MKKITAKEKTRKIKNAEAIDLPEIELEEADPVAGQVAAELHPDELKVLTKPKKGKSTVDSTDYIPELERGDTDEEFGSDQSGY